MESSCLLAVVKDTLPEDKGGWVGGGETYQSTEC